MTPEQVEFSARIRPLLKRLDGFVAARVPNQYIDDICSETIAIAWTKRDALPAVAASTETDPLLGFLLSTARFQIKNLSRRLTTSSKHMWELLQRNASSAEDVALRDSALTDAMGRLRAADRELLILSGWDELSISEIAEVLAMSSSNVSVRLSRARKRLAVILQEIEAEQR